MNERVNRRPGHCRFCGTPVAAGAGRLFWCEDGSPIYCPQHFDNGGWEVACDDQVACETRRDEGIRAQQAEDEREKQRAVQLREQVEAAREAWRAARAQILDGYPIETMYGPYQAYLDGVTGWYLKDGPALTLITEADLSDPRFPLAGGPYPALYRAEGMDVVVEIERQGNMQHWHTGDEATADEWRLAWARRFSVTAPQAAEGVTSEYISDDQRRMYQMVLAAQDA